MSDLRQLLHQHPKGFTLSEIAAHLKVTTRSARRYLEELRGDLEAVPERPSGQKRWRIPAIDLPRRVALRRTQAYALLAAQDLFEPMRGTAVFEEIDLVAEALLGVARRPGRGPNAGVAPARLEQRFRYVPFAPKDYRERSDDLDNLFHAVADLRVLSIRYPREDGAGTQRLRIHPYALLLYKEAIFTVGLDTDSEQLRTFQLDLLTDAELMGEERFELPSDFRVDDFVQGQFGLWRADEQNLRTVVIDFDPRVAQELRSRRLHPTQCFSQNPDGSLRLSLQLSNLSEIGAWVLGFGAMAVVREPVELRDRVRQQLAEAVARYDSAG